MRVFGTWHGGSNYGLGDVFLDMESWPTLEAAKAALLIRARSGGLPVDDGAHVVDFDDDGRATVGLARGSVIYPCVDAAESYVDLFVGRRDGDGWTIDVDYPMARMKLGPRGGVQVENV
ncbi:hypothetical protein [Streptomyces lydicamycinicus]|uniref:hypothetical protein n=1 Tax=Streptomyces lydicamycinicus TaxID=1546107 RepID=UPI003C2CE02E